MSDNGSPAMNVMDDSAAKPVDMRLLDNVSLMTTVSPMPSNNNSFQPGSGTQELLDGIFGNSKENAMPEENDANQVSTFADMQAQLRAQLDTTGNSAGSAGLQQDTGTGNIMYGFDLSPIHSLDKESAYTTTQDEPPTTEKLNRRNQGEFPIARNFMQAKGASRLLKSDKSGANEDTETVMSQVFSSQDVVSSTKGEKTLDEYVGLESSLDIQAGASEMKKSKKPASKPLKKTSGGASSRNKAPHTPVKNIVKAGTKPSKTQMKKVPNSPPSEVITPKSPQSRQSAMKVTPRIKTTPKKPQKKVSTVKQKRSLSQNKLSDKTKDLIMSSSTGGTNSMRQSKMLKQLLSEPDLREGTRGKNHEETVSLIHILEDLNEMRSQVVEAQENLVAVTKEKETIKEEKVNLKNENSQLKKENFVLRSRLEKLTSEPAIDTTDNENVKENQPDSMKHDRVAQERLISGYQKENERIYEELKKMKQSSKETEQAMYEENLKLQSEIAKLKEEIELQTAINKAQASGSAEFNPLMRDSERENEDDFQLHKKIDSLQNQVQAEEGLRKKSEILVRKLTDERDKAERKLVDANCKYEQSINDLVSKHKAEMESLKSELSDARRLLNNRTDTAITIRDIMNSPPSKSLLSHFQARVKKLESELASRDTAANNAIASVQKQYTEVKVRYEERINDLEKQIKAFRANLKSDVEESEDNESLKKQLSEALSKLRLESEHRKMERDALFEQINMLREQRPTTPNRNAKDAKIVEDCKQKDKEIARLTLLLEKAKFATPRKAADKKVQNIAKPKLTYNPGSFEGEGYASLVEMNGKLKKEMQDKELELKHVTVTKDAVIAKLEQQIKNQKSDFDQEISKLHQQIGHKQSSAVDDSYASKILQLETELSKRCLEVSELKNDVKEAAVFKIREQALQTQIQRLLAQLHEAKATSPSSSARKISVLENKLQILEEKLRIRESELRHSRFGSFSAILQSEIQNMQVELKRKNQELTKFRLELDSILLVLKELHTQGVKIPLPTYLQSLF